MPYAGEPPGRHSHGAVAANPEFHEFLESCEPLEGPAGADVDALLGRFEQYSTDTGLARHLLAIDGGEYVTSVSDAFPSREVLHIRIGSVLVDLQRLAALEQQATFSVDPMEVNRIERNRDAVTIFLNGANIRVRGARTPGESFRAGLLERLQHNDTRLGGRTLLDSIYDGLAQRAAAEGSLEDFDLDSGAIKLHRCPNDGCTDRRIDPPILLTRDNPRACCPNCGGPVFATDALRLHEAFNDNQGNQGLVSRTRNLLEHLLLLHYLLYLRDQPAEVVAQFAFVMDGPLAIFGEGARFHRAIMRVIGETFRRAADRGCEVPAIFGVQKSGAVLEFARALDRSGGGDAIPYGSLLLVSDELRFSYVSPRDESRTSIFGDDTYYGQDVIVKTARGHLFVLNVAYPFGSKRSEQFGRRHQSAEYPGLMRVLRTLESVESGLYGGSTVPTMLAHKYASISHVPGGRVLDILAQRSMGR